MGKPVKIIQCYCGQKFYSMKTYNAHLSEPTTYSHGIEKPWQTELRKVLQLHLDIKDKIKSN